MGEAETLEQRVRRRSAPQRGTPQELGSRPQGDVPQEQAMGRRTSGADCGEVAVLSTHLFPSFSSPLRSLLIRNELQFPGFQYLGF